MTAPAETTSESTDPMPAGKLGMSLFLASETMFFVGLLGSFLVLQSGQRQLFHHMTSMMSTWETAVLVLLLLASSVSLTAGGGRPGFRASNSADRCLRPRLIKRLSPLWIAIGLALTFAVFQLVILRHLLHTHTIVANINGKASIFNGELDQSLRGTRGDLPPDFNPAKFTHADFSGPAFVPGNYAIPAAAILQDVSYGPSRNNFLGCYFLITSTHLLHLLAGILAMLWLALRIATGNATATHISCVQNYWHFGNIVGVLGLLLLYFA